MVALSLVVLMLAAAMVLDFGLARLHRTSNKGVADAAVTAGIQSIMAPDGTEKPWTAACTALAYLKVNSSTEMGQVSGSWHTGSGAAVGGDPCASGASIQAQSCVPNDPSSWAWYQGSAGGGRVAIDIKTGYAMPDPAFSVDQVLSADNGASADGGCDQLAVIIQESDHPGLGSLATNANMVTRVRSVARATNAVDTNQAVALLVLERHNCLALDVNGNGPSIKVLGNGTAPGSIHSDSLGDGINCSSVNKIINGNFPIPGVMAAKAEAGGAPGVITVVALSGAAGAVPGNASDPSPTAVYAEGQPGGAPTGRSLVGRGYVDQRFLPYVQSAISDAAGMWGPGVAPAGFTTYGGSCTKITGSAGALAAQYIYFPCPNGAVFTDATLPNAVQVVFAGPVTVGSNNSLAMPLVQRVYVRGAAGAGINLKGSLQVNNGGPATTSCAAYHSVAPAARAEIVVGQGSFVSGAGVNVMMCGTAVVMADNSGTPACPLPASVTFPGPAPYPNACQGSVSLGGGGNIDWSAPNATSAAPTLPYKQQLEDLALWTETSAGNSIGGNGSMSVSGVFFAPNADPFKIAGGGSQTNPANAQFVSRTLQVSGNGTILLRPNPNDVVGIPLPTQYSLVR
jgi:hypothetical protein